MWPLFVRTFKDRRTNLITYIISSIALLWMYVSFFPAIKDQSASLASMLQSYPAGLMKAFNIDINTFVTIEGFLSSEHFSFVWPLLMIFMIVGFAGSALAGEIEKGTTEILLSLPLQRWKIFASKYLVGLLLIILFVASSTYAIIPFCKMYNISFVAKNIATMTLLSFLFTLSVFSVSMFFSSCFADKGKVFFASGAFMVGMYVVNIISTLKESLSDLKYLSLFYYFNPAKALIYNSVDHWAYLIFISFSVIFTILALIIFTKRDAV